MPKVSDLTGKTFGRLVVIKRHPQNDKYGRSRWECLCSPELGGCGNTMVAYAGNLKNQHTQSCGCLNKEATKNAVTQHGLTNTPEHWTWSAIKRRCYNENSPDYPDYGGRGIVMCEEWKNDFTAFLRDMGPRPSPEHSIDRKDNDKGYDKENCRWATQLEQANNKRNSIFYEINGERKTLGDWCRLYGLTYSSVFYRINVLGMSVEKALNHTPISSNDVYTINGISKALKNWCRCARIPFRKVAGRLYNGWTLEEALIPIERKLITLDGHSEYLEDWCAILDLDSETTYLRIIRGEDIDSIVNEE